MAGVVHIPWYATFFRAEKFADALTEMGAVALRYGATEYSVQQSLDDKYKFLQLARFDSKLDWERYWNSQEFRYFREEYASWYQVPVLYVWHQVLGEGRTALDEVAAEEPVPEPEPEPTATS